MDAPDLAPLLDTLEDTIDDLEDALAPLLAATGDQTLATLAAKAPLLDKAQLYVAVTYTVESLLFCRFSLFLLPLSLLLFWNFSFSCFFFLFFGWRGGFLNG